MVFASWLSVNAILTTGETETDVIPSSCLRISDFDPIRAGAFVYPKLIVKRPSSAP